MRAALMPLYVTRELVRIAGVAVRGAWLEYCLKREAKLAVAQHLADLELERARNLQRVRAADPRTWDVN